MPDLIAVVASAAAPLIAVPAAALETDAGELTALAAQIEAAAQQSAAQASTIADQTSTIASQAAQITALKSQASAPPIALGQPYTSTTGNLVFAHWQLSCLVYGAQYGSGTQAGYLAAITKARSLGIDAFSIDTGGNGPNYLYSLAQFYAACNQFNAANQGAVNDKGVGDFKLFLTFDFATFPETSAAILPILLNYLRDPANLQVKGKPYFSTYVGEGNGWAYVDALWQPILAALKTAGITPYFEPGFNVTDSSGTYVALTPQNLAAQSTGELAPIAQGAWDYASGGSPLVAGSTLLDNEAQSQAYPLAGLTWMAPLKASQWGGAHGPGGRFYEEYYGGEGLAAYWRSIINVQKPPRIQFCTWNDYDEATNFDAEPDILWPFLAHSSIPGWYPSRAGLQADFQYGLQWYKTGRQPVIANDTLIMYYLPQTPTCMVAAGLTDPLGPITQVDLETGQTTGPNAALAIPCQVCVTVRVKASGYVTLTVPQAGQAAYTQTRFVPAGETFLRLPTVAGTQTLTLTRGSATDLTLTGGVPVVSTAAVVNANVFSYAASN